ncbi:hypothetical protein GCM10023115_26290 [Pontixanthobacter gangjinensis]|uniref:Peptidase M56 domain-containing protein n=1 Tax=Christiangramia aestuarii TaxID=1028746 RepID=A0A7K1LM18_9FLAO|nr:M56 family metallopeptidase [Christiangramia aestuarii]MUP41865.1 hypothetical protein [Christiangramia aestuarii]
MEAFLIYILKASILLGVFYLSYILLLKRETSFELNRKFLIGGVFTSFLLPLIYFTRKIYIEASPFESSYIPVSSDIPTGPVEESIDWWQITGMLYLLITGFFFLRFCLQLSGVIKLIIANRFEKKEGLKYLRISENQLPFSFFNYIVFNPDKHSEKDLALILEHEKVHACQWHSMDILLLNLVSCALWFNPFAWWYKRSVEQNLEFIADRETVSRTEEIKEYQHALVKVSIADLRPALTNHFYQSFIKKRILMLNKRSSNQSPAWKLSLLMPVLLAFMLLFNVKTEAQVVEKEETRSLQKTPDPKTEEAPEVQIEQKVETQEDVETPREIRVEISEAPEIRWNTATAPKPGKSLTEIGANPLYIINGKRYKASRLKNKYIGLRSRLEALTGEEAKERFGEEATNGAIIIKDAEIIRNFDKEMEKIEGRAFNGRYLMIGENGKPNFIDISSSSSGIPNRKRIFGKKNGDMARLSYNLKNDHYAVMHGDLAPSSENIIAEQSINLNSTGKNRSIYFRKADSRSPGKSKDKYIVLNQDNTPLYVVNEEVKGDDFDAKSIDKNDIASINVFKGDSAIRLYGEKAENGVIVIKTKAFAKERSSIFKISKDFSDDQLKAIQKEAETKTGYQLELENIERNSDGLITRIEVKFHRENSMVQSQYFNTNGIPDIHVGLKDNGGLIISAAD